MGDYEPEIKMEPEKGFNSKTVTIMVITAIIIGAAALSLGIVGTVHNDVNKVSGSTNITITGSQNDPTVNLKTALTEITSIDSTTSLSLGAKTSSDFSVTGSGQNLNLEVSGGGTQKLSLNSAGTGTDAIDITASSGDISLTTQTNGKVIVNTGFAGTISHTSDGDNKDFTIEQLGAHDSSLLLSSAGIGSDAIALKSTTGGILLETSAVAKATEFKGHNGTGVVSLGKIGSVAANHIIGMKQYVNIHVSYVSADTWPSGALSQPANTILTNLGIIATAAVTTGSGDTTLTVGTAAGGAQIVTSTSIGSATTEPMAIGEGISLISNQFPITEAGTPTTLAAEPNMQHSTTARDIHFTLTAGSGPFTTGKICFFIEYMHCLTT